ncbi:TPA: phage tail tape measure protein [Clostridium botulinum]|nr:phage tail tape measure protein [Clostridium botulinum]
MKKIANKVINTILNLKDNFSKGLKSATSSTATFKKQMKVAENAGTKMRSTFKNVFSSIASSASVLGTISLTGLTASSVKTYATFEKSMSKVQALSGATGEDFKKLSDKAKEMGAATSKTASESADALGYMALAGWNTKQMLTGLEPILRASEAGEMDLATCSDLVTDSMSAMGISVDNLGHYLDVVAKAQASSNTSMQGLLEAYIGCGGTLKNMNVSVEESATLLGTLANRGKKSSEAGNALNSILINLMGTTSTTSGALKELGVSAYDSEGNFRGVTTTLKDLSVAFAKCTPQQRDMLQAQLGGKTQMDTLQALLSGVNEEYDTLNGKLKDCNGYMTEAAKTMQNNLIGKLTALKSAFEGVQIQIGEKLAPYLMSFMDNITVKLPKIGEKISSTMEKVIVTIPKIKKVLSELSPVIAGIVAGLASFMIITKITSSAKNFTKIFEKFAILTSPIGLACIAIGSLVAIIIHLMNTNEEFRNNMEHCYQRIKTQVIFAIESIQFKLREMKETYGSVGEYIKSKMPLIASIGGIVGGLLAFKALSPFSGIINKIGLSFGKSLIPMFSFKNILLSIKNIPGMLLAPINLLKNGIVSLQRTFVLAKAFLPGILSGGFSKIGIVFKSLLHPITLLKKGFTIIRTALMAVVTPVGIVIAVIGALVAGFIYCWNTNSDFRDKMIEAWNSISSAIVNIVGIVVGWISELASFLIGFYTEHQSQIDGLLNAVLNTIGVVIEQIVSIITGIVEIISGIFQVIDGLIHGDWSEMWEGCKTIFKGAIDAITGWWDGLREIFSHPLKAMINVFKHDSGSDEETTNEVAHNATGTSYFRGGLTTVNENSGKELIRLPSGTQIVPGDKTKKIMNGTNNVPPVTVIVQGNIIGNKEYADYLGNHILSEIKLGMLNI